MANFNIYDYVQVNERIEKFYEKYPEGSIQTEIQSNENGIVIFKAYAYRTKEDTRPATGHAYEKEGSSFINKTSYIENCETSAVGRALAMLGFEIKKSIASREEVANAKLQQEIQETGDAKISAPKILALQTVCKNKNLKKSQLDSVLNYFSYNAIEDIKNKDYMDIYSRINAIKEA